MSPSYEAPPGYDPSNSTAPELSVDPMQVVESGLPWIQEQMNSAFADAGARFGRGGMLASSPYMETLGGVARKASDDIASLYWQTMLQAAESQAAREFQAQQSALEREYGAWAQQGNWQQAQQLADMANSLSAWAQQGNWSNASQLAQIANSLSAWATQGGWQNQQQLQDMQNQFSAWLAEGNWQQEANAQQQQGIIQMMQMMMGMMDPQGLLALAMSGQGDASQQSQNNQSFQQMLAWLQQLFGM